MKRKGGFETYILAVVLILITVGVTAVFIFHNLARESRFKIQNGVTAATLALYQVVEQGNPSTVVQFTPDDLKKLLSNPQLIQQMEQQYPDEFHHTDVINLLTSEYFPPGQRYKCIYLDKQKALETFKTYLCKNLNVYEDPSNPNVFLPNSDNKYIVRIELQEFFVHNAIPLWDEDIDNPRNDIKNRKYTSVHVYLIAYVRNKNTDTKESRIPIHIDTDLTLYRYVN